MNADSSCESSTETMSAASGVAAGQEKAAKIKILKRRYTHDGKLVKVLEDEDAFYKPKIVEKAMHPQKKITHRYMKVLEGMFPNDEVNEYLGFKYDYLELGLYANVFILNSQKYMKEQYNMILNYKKMQHCLNNLNDLVSTLTLKEQFYASVKRTTHLSNGTPYEIASKDYFDQCQL
jgi:hypothetical protein